MGKTYLKIIIREIKQSFGRFFAIFAIVALGVGFLAGLLATTPDMKLSVNQYYENQQMADIFIKSTLGLTKEDLMEISKIEEVQQMMPAYVTDILMGTDSNEILTTRVFGLPSGQFKKGGSNIINQLKLLQGKMPKAEGECVVEQAGPHLSEVEIGTTLTISKENKDYDEIDDIYNQLEYTVVGIVANPFYFSKDREASSVGNGSISTIMYVNEASYALDVYTDVYMQIANHMQLPAFADEYENYMEQVVKKIEKVGKPRSLLRFKEVKEEADNKLDTARTELEDAQKKADLELDEALEEIEFGKAEIALAEDDLARARQKLSQGEAELAAEQASYEKEISFQKANLDAAYNQIQEAKQRLILSGSQAYNMGISQLLAQESDLLNARLSLESAKKEGAQKIALAEEDLNKARKDIEAGQEQVTQVREELIRGEVAYRRGKEKSEQALAEGEIKIDEAEEKVEDIEDAKWYVLDRTSNISYASFAANVEKVAAIATVFPIFFFLVAALVALTTMTRMVEEGRTQIGTLKALGYTQGTIMSKYLIYSALATITGSIVGLLAGFQILPVILWNAYGSVYHLPPFITQFSWPFAIISSTIATLSTMGATIAAGHQALKEKPATLMLPRAPKAGKRIFLENIDFIWSRMKFTYKATARNLIRYKKHFFMTVIGIAGCTALIVAGFGLRDSVSDIANTQFSEIFQYDLLIEKDDTGKDDAQLGQFLSDTKKVTGHTEAYGDIGETKLNGKKFATSIYVPKNPSSFNQFIHLRNRKTGKQIVFDHQSVVITEKLADALEIKVGDPVVYKDSDDYEGKFIVTDIAENYVGSYLYVNKEDYSRVFEEEVNYDTVLVKTSILEESEQEAVLTEVLTGETVLNAEFMSQTRETYNNLLSSINFVVIVLILAAGGLAIIVLYNLTNINIEERRKELATLKVLGFHNKEVAGYIFRETTILSIIGTLVGLLLGIVLHAFVIRVAEATDLMFGRNISVMSFVLSALVTLLFSAVVDIMMVGKLKNIEMVDSMKAID